MSVMDPQAHQRAQARPRPKSTFSFRSDKSSSTARSSKRETLVESHEEKRKTYLSSTTKANPNAAITEQQPVAAALEKPTLASLRGGSYNDQYGNPITDPDLSNPTRPRWETPLDTIRSFEAAIDAEYKTRQTLLRPDTSTGTNDGNGYSSRRSSSYWGGGYDQARPRYSSVGGGYYGGSNPNRDSYAENGSYSSPAVGPGRYRHNMRQHTDPTPNRIANSGPGIYPAPGHQQSRDTVNTGATGGSGGSGSEAYVTSTDPTSGSENNSIEKNNPTSRPEFEGQNGYQSYGVNFNFRGPIMEEDGPLSHGYNQGRPEGSNGYFSQTNGDTPPAPPPKTEVAPPVQRPIVLNGNTGVADSNTQRPSRNSKLQRPAIHKQESVKRKSWLARRFSKN